MNIILELMDNNILILSIISLILAQFLKIITHLIVYRKINILRAFDTGGMPSSHSSFVTTLATMVGLTEGFNSTFFAVACVFALITMHDASGVRMAVGKQARVLNELRNILGVIVSEDLKPDEKMKELVGHTKVEVFMGFLLGIIVAVVGYNI